MQVPIESEKLHRTDYIHHPLFGVDIVVDAVAAAVGGGWVVAVACQCSLSLGGVVCHATEWIGAAWEVARRFLFKISVTAIAIVTPPVIKS